MKPEWLPPRTTTDRPRSKVPDDRFAMAKEASAARYVRLLIVVQGGHPRWCRRRDRFAAASTSSIECWLRPYVFADGDGD
jgi:hypothetical protein